MSEPPDEERLDRLCARIESKGVQVERGWIPEYVLPSRTVGPRLYQQFKENVLLSREHEELRAALRTDAGQRYIARRLIRMSSLGVDVFPHPDDVAIAVYLWVLEARSWVGQCVAEPFRAPLRQPAHGANTVVGD